MKNGLPMLLVGFAAGVVTMAALPVLKPMFTDVARPVTKALLKHGLLGIERVRTSIAVASEALEDLLAEVRAEVEVELAKMRNANGSSVAATGPAAQASPTSIKGASPSLS